MALFEGRQIVSPQLVEYIPDFPITQILREIKIGDFRSAKSAISIHLEALKFFLMNFCTFWRLKFTKLTKFRAPKMAKTAVSQILDSPKLISRKI